MNVTSSRTFRDVHIFLRREGIAWIGRHGNTVIRALIYDEVIATKFRSMTNYVG